MERVATDEVKKTTVKNVLISMETRYNYVLDNGKHLHSAG
jgi:hypothetical protein